MNDRLKSLAIGLAIALAVISGQGCASYFRLFGGQSYTFTAGEVKILEKTTKAIEFDYGYDDDIGLDYVYPYPNSMDALKNNENKFMQAVDDIDNTTLIKFFEKVYGVREKTVLLRDLAEAREQWTRYTYISKYLLPGIEEYTKVLERRVLARDPAYGSVIDEKKAAVREALLRRMQDEENRRRLQETERIVRERK
ncbi:MAG: hypothetical protein JXA20_15700 [Spirochaetes bacterium]|nr:hypothetical protein [Spirochaetota bacterium]